MIKVSPSQIETFSQCQRKWALDKIDRIPRPQNEAAAKGERVHKICEDWLRDGIPVPDTEDGKTFMPAVRHLPPPGVVDVESAFKFQVGNVIYNGRRDGAWSDIIFDLKTTSSFAWAKSEDDLLEDTQAIIYAEKEFRENPDLRDVELFWLYVLTGEKKQSRPVKVRVAREHVAQEFARIETIVEEMVQIRLSGKTGLDLPPTPSHCSAYGGCAYKNVCNLSSEERLRAVMTQGSLADRLKKRVAEKQTTPEKIEDAVTLGLCSCGAEGELNDEGKLKPHKKQDGKLCIGGKKPLTEEKEQEVEELRAAINPPEAPKVEKTPAPRATPAAKKTEDDEDAQVLVILEAMDPAAVQRARLAVQRLKGTK